MPESYEGEVVAVPLFDQIAQALKEKGAYERVFTPQEITKIMSDLVASAPPEPGVEAAVSKIGFDIKQNRGIFHGIFEVKRPIQAKVTLQCAFANGDVGHLIKLAGLQVQTEAGFFAKRALSALNIEGQTREELQDPNKAVYLALTPQLAPRGIKLTGVGLHLNPSTLTVSLRGQPAAPNRQ